MYNYDKTLTLRRKNLGAVGSTSDMALLSLHGQVSFKDTSCWHWVWIMSRNITSVILKISFVNIHSCNKLWLFCVIISFTSGMMVWITLVSWNSFDSWNPILIKHVSAYRYTISLFRCYFMTALSIHEDILPHKLF